MKLETLINQLNTASARLQELTEGREGWLPITCNVICDGVSLSTSCKSGELRITCDGHTVEHDIFWLGVTTYCEDFGNFKEVFHNLHLNDEEDFGGPDESCF